MSMQLDGGIINKRQDMKTTRDEAANMIVQQVADVKAKEVLAVVYNTDMSVFVGFTSVDNVEFQLIYVLLVSPIRSSAVTVTNTNATVD